MPIKAKKRGKEMVWAIVFMLYFTNQLVLVAQAVPNGDFEDWITDRADILEPVGWETQNDAQLLYVERTEGHTGNYAVCLNVVWDKMMQSFSGATISAENDIEPQERIRNLTGYYKAISDENDTLKINISIYSNNELIGVGSGSYVQATNGWIKFTIPVKYYSNIIPEKVRISISVIPVAGSRHQSTYCIDDLAFTEKTNY